MSANRHQESAALAWCVPGVIEYSPIEAWHLIAAGVLRAANEALPLSVPPSFTIAATITALA